MKKLLKLIVIVAVVCVVVYFGPKLIHKCDSCDKVFFGTGYEANILADVIADDDQTICKSCAEKQHIIEKTIGKPLNDYKKKLFK